VFFLSKRNILNIVKTSCCKLIKKVLRLIIKRQKRSFVASILEYCYSYTLNKYSYNWIIIDIFFWIDNRKCFFLRTLMPSKTSLAAEFQAHAKLGSNAVSCIPRSLLSPRVLLHRLVSASRVPSRFRYNRRRRAYVCDIYTCIDSTITRTVA